jgi:hypothetical protein
MSQRATLVFPAVNEPAFRYLRQAVARGERVVGAASVTVADFDPAWGKLEMLPSIHDTLFEQCLSSLLRERNVQQIYCPISSVHDHVRRLIREGQLKVELVGVSPIREQMAEHYSLMRRATVAHEFALSCGTNSQQLELIEVAGILKQSGHIYGESNDEKLAALIGIFAEAPEGDVVEIGSLMGRSAFVLRYLSWRYSTGAVLTIDPWSSNEAVQHQSPKDFQSLVDEWDFEVLAQGFNVNMVPMCTSNHAHLRMTSARGHEVYAGTKVAKSLLGHDVEYRGSIAALHIDGNHDFEAVRTDCLLWLPHMVSKGWLVLDDYIWAHGDGPHRLGNQLLRNLAGDISRSFVAGKALFVHFGSPLDTSKVARALAG